MDGITDTKHAKLRSPLNYFGSKSRIASRIVKHFPTHHTFVDVFGGSAAVLLAKAPSPVEVYNDIDGDLVNFFRVLQDLPLYSRLCWALTSGYMRRTAFQSIDAGTRGIRRPSMSTSGRHIVRLDTGLAIPTRSAEGDSLRCPERRSAIAKNCEASRSSLRLFELVF